MIIVPDWKAYLAYRDKFKEVTDERYYPIEWLDERIVTGIARFMCSENAAIIAEIRLYPGGARDVHGLVAAGDKDEIVNILIPQAEEWGRQNACVAGVVESRPGWARALKPSGYEVSQVTVRKEL
jgi:hypothetical protein